VIAKSDLSQTTITTTRTTSAPEKFARVNLPDVEAAQSYQKSMLGKELGAYDQRTNSCVDHVAEVLRAGGTDVPKSVLGE
jgi:hypothetical protein